MAEFLAILLKIWPILLGAALFSGWVGKMLLGVRDRLQSIENTGNLSRAEFAAHTARDEEYHALVTAQYSDHKGQIDSLRDGWHSLDKRIQRLEIVTEKN